MAKTIDYVVLALLIGVALYAMSLAPNSVIGHCPKGTINCPVDTLQ